MQVLDFSTSNSQVSDEIINVPNSTPVGLQHDVFYNKTGKLVVIRTAAGGGGTLLTETTDYTLGSAFPDADFPTSISPDVGYQTVAITNATYQNTDLYVSYYPIADIVNAAKHNDLDNRINSLESYYKVTDTKTSGTNGGTFTAGSWQTRVLNTENTASMSGASLSSNQFTLAAGTYFITAKAAAYQVGVHRTRIYNVSDTTAEIYSCSDYTGTSAEENSYSVINGRISITSSKTFELQHICQNTTTTTGFGVQGGSVLSTPNEIYSEVHIWRIYE